MPTGPTSTLCADLATRPRAEGRPAFRHPRIGIPSVSGRAYYTGTRTVVTKPSG